MRLSIKLALLGAAALAATIAACGPGEPTAEEKAEIAQRLEAEQKQRLVDDLAAFPASAASTIANLQSISERDVSDMAAAVDTIEAFDMAALRIRIIEEAAKEGDVHVSAEALAAKDELKRVLVQTQTELFPAMRRTYAAHMSDAVAHAQANIRAVGTAGKTLRAASPSFTSQEVVMDAHYTLVTQATRFRFQKAEYVYSLTGARDVIAMRGRGDEELSR